MPLVKPRRSVYRPGNLPGVQLLVDFREGAGSPQGWVYGQRTPGVVTGSPAWTISPYGPAITSLSSTKYIDYPVLCGPPPRWQAMLFTNTSTAEQNCGFASVNDTAPLELLRLNYNSTAGQVAWFTRSDASATVATAATSLPCNDGLPHVVMGTTNVNGDASLYWDGQLVASGNYAGSYTVTATQYSLGVIHRSSVSGSMDASLIVLGAGSGAIPDPWWIYQDWITGQFSSFRPDRRRRLRGLLVSLPSVLATGATSLAGISLAGHGKLTVAASSITTLAAVVAASSGRLSISVSGSPHLGSLAVSGGSTHSITSTASIALGAIQPSASGSIVVSAVGSIDLASIGATGETTRDTTSDGIIPLAGATVEATATVAGGFYEGSDVFEALANWWAANGSTYSSDGELWYSEAPETIDLPYCTYFGVSEESELITTSSQSYRTTIQFNAHAATPGAALALAKQIREAIKGAPLHVDGRGVWFVRPSSMILPQVGEGRGPNGSDCWMAGVTFDIPWNS